MNHYTYIIDYSDGKHYIGVRTCACSPEEDNYWGSSKYTPDDLIVRKRILKTFSTRKQAVKHEIMWHNKLDIANNPKFYNRAKQTSTKFDTRGVNIFRSTEHNQKIKKALTGRIRSEQERVNISKGKIGKGVGRKHSPATKKAISDSRKGKPHPISEYSFDARKEHYSSRSKDLTKYHWINTITGQQAYETYTDMGYLYGERSKTVKPPVPFRKMVQGKQHSYKGWKLNTGMN